MIVMVLDHLRDFLGDAHFDATDLTKTTVPIFLSRWITHLCAPAFFLLAGTSAALAQSSTSRLIARGITLVVVEQTVLHLAWYFHADYHFMNAGVLYGLGTCMVMMGVLKRLGPTGCLLLGVALIFAQPAIAQIDLGTPWDLLAKSSDHDFNGYHFYVSYPPIPWLGAMLFGYGLAQYRERAAPAGLAFLLAFVIIRLVNVWDTPWHTGETGLDTVLSFVNVSKYPPTTPFLLLTLGIALVAFAMFDRKQLEPQRPILEVFGRVPLFFYIVHIPLIHAIAVGYSYAMFGDAVWLRTGPVIFWDVPLPGSPSDYGLPLWAVYLVWIAFVAAMYPICRWWWWRTKVPKRSAANF
jgi:uncharacterized membrane protein